MEKLPEFTSDNPEHLFVQFIRTFFSYVKEKMAEGTDPVYSYPHIFFEKNLPVRILTNPTHFDISYEERQISGVSLVSPSFYKLFFARYQKSKGIKELLDQIVQVFQAASVLELPPEMAESKISTIDILESFAVDLAQYYYTLDLSNEQIIDRFRYLQHRWKLNIWKVTSPLFNVESNIEHEISFVNGMKLEPLTPKEKTLMVNQRGDPLSSLVQPFPINIYLLDQTSLQLTRDAKLEELKTFTFSNALYLIITALRLYKAGYVEAPVVLTERRPIPLTIPITSAFMVNGGVSQIGRLRTTPFIHRTPYLLSEDDIPDIKSLHEALLKLVPRQTQKAQQKPYGDMTVALRRFNQSYNRDTFEDQIIDLTIALESTLLAGLEDELKYRLALRGAALLENLWEPQKSQLLLKTIYDVRSSIVHDGMQLNDAKIKKIIRKSLPGNTDPGDFFLSCENIVRDILKTCVNRLSKGQSLEQLNDDLEKYVITHL